MSRAGVIWIEAYREWGGAYTTFSTFEYETQRLTEAGALWWGGLNVIASVAAGFAAVQLGVFLAR